MQNAVARIFDVNINRAGEAMRTMEEYARFILESPALSGRCKRARHSLAALSARAGALFGPDGGIVASRDIDGDVGAALKTAEERSRPDTLSVAAAASRRAAEALRALSEYGKTRSPELGLAFEKLRYEIYAIEPALLAKRDLKNRLADAGLYVLITSGLCSTDPRTACREAVRGGADIIQMREKEMEDGEFYTLALAMAEICREGNALFLINDRPHIAALVGASGIHGGQGDLPVHLARRILGQDAIVGRSTSEPALAEEALRDGADYIGVGPVYETNTKMHRKAVGLDYVKWAAQWGRLPFFAIGSINRETIGGVLDAGAKAVAICTAITRAKDIAAETAHYKNLVCSARG